GAAAGKAERGGVATPAGARRLGVPLGGAALSRGGGAGRAAKKGPAGRGLFAIERLEATAGERRDCECGGGPHDSPVRRARGSPALRAARGADPRAIRALVMPPH